MCNVCLRRILICGGGNKVEEGYRSHLGVLQYDETGCLGCSRQPVVVWVGGVMAVWSGVCGLEGAGRGSGIGVAVGGVVAPTFEDGGEVVWPRALEMEMLMGGGVLKAEDEGMECLTRHEAEAVFDKLLVAREGGAFEDAVATIGGIVEEGVSEVLHVGTYLMGAACLQDAFHEGDVAETLQDMPVCDGVLAAVGVIRHVHDATILRGALKVAHNGARVLIEAAPDEGVVLALDGVLEELLGEDGLGIFVLGDEEQS